MKTGIILYFNPERAFGFIRPDDGSADHHVRLASVNGGATPAKGDQVQFESTPGKPSPRALDVTILEPEINEDNWHLFIGIIGKIPNKK